MNGQHTILIFCVDCAVLFLTVDLSTCYTNYLLRLRTEAYIFRLLNLPNNSLSDAYYRRSWSRLLTPCEHIDTSTEAAGRRAPRTSDATDLPESTRAHQKRCKIRTEARARESIWIFFRCRHENNYRPSWASVHTMLAILHIVRLNYTKYFNTKHEKVYSA